MLQLPQTLTQVQATACLRALLQALRAQAGQPVVVDASALTRFDSSALAVLLALRRATLALGQSFSIQALPIQLANLAALYGIETLLPADAVAPVK